MIFIFILFKYDIFSNFFKKIKWTFENYILELI